MSLQISFEKAIQDVRGYLNERAAESEIPVRNEHAYKLGCAEALLAMVLCGDLSVKTLREKVMGAAQ